MPNKIFETIRNELYTPVVGDILDKYRRFHQFLPQGIRPLRPDMKLVGYAMPVLTADVFDYPEKPFGLLTEALDALEADEVYISAGSSHRSACWGEIMTSAAKARGAVGAVVDGYHRDTPQVLEQQFPVFSSGHYAQDSGPRMRVAEIRCRIEIGQVTIRPGDLVFGDIDGVLVIPVELIDEVVSASLEKSRSEKHVRKAIASGMSATDAFRKYGVL